MMKIPGIRRIKGEIQDTDHIDSLQLIIPLATPRLLTDRKGGVENAAVLEELLLATLHLDKEFLTLLILTVHVEYSPTVILLGSEMFGVEIGHILNHLLTEQ